MKRFIYMIFVFFIISCQNKKSVTTYQEMKSDKLLSAHFSEKEMKDLAKIVDFFESQVSKKYSNSNTENLQETYKRFNIADSIEYHKNFSYLLIIDYKKQKDLYTKIDSNLIYKIWEHPISVDTGKPIRESLFIKCYGDYLKFLKEVGDNLKFRIFKKYAEDVEKSCGISIQNTIDLSLNYRFFDTKDIKTRLLFAIHYLSTNEELIQPQIKK